YRQVLDKHGETEFLGYESLECDARILAVIKDGKAVQSLGEGEDGELILDQTTFYAESGGQIGDTGLIDCVTGSALVKDTRAPLKNLRVHKVVCNSGTLSVGDKVRVQVDAGRRREIMSHHTATHLLQA